MERRKFFGALSIEVVGMSASLRSRAAGRNFLGEMKDEKLPRRPLGRTGEKLSIIGLGGLVPADETQEAAILAMKQFGFDTVLFPINFVCFLKADFGPRVVAAAKEKNMGILALKALARQPWPEEKQKNDWPKCWYQPILDPEEAGLSLRFTLSQPVTAAVPPGDVRLFKRALELAHRFSPIRQEEEAKLRQLAATLNPLFTLPST